MNEKNLRISLLGVIIASILWSIVFLSDILFSFWIRVTAASIILALFPYLSADFKSNNDLQFRLILIIKGLISGIFLYLSFLFGFTMFKPFLQSGAVNVYLIKNESPLWFAAITLIITSICEELFWRRFTQSSMIHFLGSAKGIVITSLAYSLIHLPTLNGALIVAALIAGMFWGIIYHQTNSFWIVALSHITWTELIFIFLPLA